MLRVHQLNAQFIWSCIPRLHDNLGLAGVGQEKTSQHHSTGKLAIFHQSSPGTTFCFLSWSSPLLLDCFFKRTYDQRAIKREGAKHWRQELWDGHLEFCHELPHKYLSKAPPNAKMHGFLWLWSSLSALWGQHRTTVSHSRWWSYTRGGSCCVLYINTRIWEATNGQGVLGSEGCGSHNRLSQLTVPVQLQNLLVLKWWSSHSLSGGDRR